MPVARYLQSTFASGEFDPLLNAREDVAFYYSSAFRLENVIPLPQGGGKRREGLKRIGLLRGALTEIDMTAPTYSLINGGTAANFYSEDPASTFLTTGGGLGTSTEYSVLTWDFGSNVRKTFLDLNVTLVGGNLDTCTLTLQSSTDGGSSWTDRAAITIGRTAYDQRFALEPDTDIDTRDWWRLILSNPDALDYGACEIEIYNAKAYTEAGFSQTSAEPGASKIRRITTSVDSEYFAVFTAGNVDIYTSAGVWQAAATIPHTEAQISELKFSQQRDTMVVYQQDQPPYVVQRLNEADDIWRSGEFIFDDVAQFPFEDATTGGQNEKQFVNFGSMSAGDTYVVEFNGEISDEITWSATSATNATRINDALESLSDINSVTVTDESAANFTVEFDGVDANRFFATIIVDILTGSGVVVTSRTKPGRPNQEDLWSPTRGYPSCGTFYQGRHWMGGFKSRPDVIVGSRSGGFDEFREDADPVATSPLVLAPDTDEQVTIQDIHAGRNLQIFTSSAEIYIPNEPITPDNVALKVSSRRGSQALTQPVDVQGGTFFVDRNGTNLREYLFQESEQSYTAEPISTLGGHLVQQPSDMALRLSVDTDEPTLLYIVNTGRDRDFEKVPAAVCTIDRAQQVTAFARMTTGGGEFLGVAATQGGETAAIIKRSLAGAEWDYLEIFDDTFLSDAAEEIANTELDAFTATAAQTVFTYTFSNPIDDNDIAVFQRADTADRWRRIEQADYTLDTGAKTITLDTGLDAGTLVTVAKRQTTVSGISPQLEGIECYVHGDGRPFGLHTPSSNAISVNGDEGFFFAAQIGLRMVPSIVLQAYKGQGGQSPTMKRQRIFRALVNVERTSHIAIGMNGTTPRAVALTDYDGATYDLDLEEILFTGSKRVSGIGKWELEPRLLITQTEPGPFVLRAASYDIRF